MPTKHFCRQLKKRNANREQISVEIKKYNREVFLGLIPVGGSKIALGKKPKNISDKKMFRWWEDNGTSVDWYFKTNKNSVQKEDGGLDKSNEQRMYETIVEKYLQKEFAKLKDGEGATIRIPRRVYKHLLIQKHRFGPRSKARKRAYGEEYKRRHLVKSSPNTVHSLMATGTDGIKESTLAHDEQHQSAIGKIISSKQPIRKQWETYDGSFSTYSSRVVDAKIVNNTIGVVITEIHDWNTTGRKGGIAMRTEIKAQVADRVYSDTLTIAYREGHYKNYDNCFKEVLHAGVVGESVLVKVKVLGGDTKWLYLRER